jgi:hypothetical protein
MPKPAENMPNPSIRYCTEEERPTPDQEQGASLFVEEPGRKLSRRCLGQCTCDENRRSLSLVPVIGEDQQFVGARTDDHRCGA